MSEKPEIDLLVDIVKLLKKYGPNTFETLAKYLSLPEFSHSLIDILTKSAKAGKSALKQSPSKKPKTNRKDYRSSLIDLGQTEPVKSQLLLTLYDNLITKQVLPKLRDIQAFLSDTGHPPLKAKSRDKAITSFLKMLSSLPIDKLKILLSEIKPMSTQDDRSLEGWSNIILNKERRKKEDI